MKIIGENIPNMPWEEMPEGCTEVFWRSVKNPIITKELVPEASTILNSCAVPYEGKFAGVFRVDNKTYWPKLHVGFSDDGVNWNISSTEIKFIKTNGEIEDFVYGYDPRVCKIDDKYIITWCNECHGNTIGVGYTYDFKEFYQMTNAFLPANRNGVMVPKKINGMYMMYSRPNTDGFEGKDIFISESPDLEFWGRHKFVMDPISNWESRKIGPGPVPIETDEGWLYIYHGVLKSCNGYRYYAGAAIMDLEKPWIVKHRCDRYVFSPEELYERCGDVDNVVFPCATLCDAETGRIAMYYGAADTVVGLAYTTVDRLVDYIKKYDLMK